jgi:hypothetical protein
MNPAANQEITEIIEEINRIKRELDNVALELRAFKGIGAEKCAIKLQRISNEYNEVTQSLYRLR